jgi:hypothetical protein
MQPEDWAGVGKVLFFFLYYSCIVLFYIFKAAIDYGGATAGAIVLLVFLVLALSNRP